MFPSRFGYEAPRTLDEAVGLLQQGAGEYKVLAGGQSLIPMLKLRFANPELLVDINNLPGLDGISPQSDGSLRIGALARHGTLERNAMLPAKHPLLAAVAPLVADPLVRSRGTLVGSLCHADPQGDWSTAVTALDGSVIAYGPGGHRTIAIGDFVQGPFTNALAYDEIAVEAVIPAARHTPYGGYLKLERRVGDFATAGVGVALEIGPGGSVSKAGIALTGVGSATINAAGAAAAVMGGQLSAASIERAADLASQAAEPKSDHRGSADYKRHIVATFTQRILTRIVRQQERAA